VKAVAIALAVVAAVALQTVLARIAPSAAMNLDLVLVVVTYLGLGWGPGPGLLAGTAGGLSQDILSGGTIGVGGLAGTVVGFLAGIVGTQFIVGQPLPRVIAFVGATLVRVLVVAGLFFLLDLRPVALSSGRIALQAVGNATVGVLLCRMSDWLPAAVERRTRDRAR
jgi:rod shape-determining protein MreD